MASSYPIKNFKFGLDTRKDVLTSQVGTLVTCENCHVNPGGELEKRKMFDMAYDTSVFDNDALAVTINRVSTSAIVTLAAHGLAVGDEVKIAGATDPAYNGIKTVLTVSTNTFTYEVLGSPGAPAAGAPTCSFMGTFGLESTEEGLVTFGSALGSGSAVTNEPSLASPLPSGITYKQLRHPGIGMPQGLYTAIYDYKYHRMTAVVFSVNFNGGYWVAARFTDGRTFLYYNSSVPIWHSWNGLGLEIPNAASYNVRTIGIINLLKQFQNFGWVVNDAGLDVDNLFTPSVEIKSPAGDFFGAQISYDSDSGQVGATVLDTDGKAEPGVRPSILVQMTVLGTVSLTAPISPDPLAPDIVDINITGGLTASKPTIAEQVQETVDLINAFSINTGYDAVVAGPDTFLVFAPIGWAGLPLTIQLTQLGSATLVSTAGSTSTVVGVAIPSPLEAIRNVPSKGAGWMVSGEAAIYVFGGLPPYTFKWSEISAGTGNGITIEDDDDPTTSFSKAIPENSEVSGQFKCEITAQSGLKTTVYLTVYLKAVYKEGQ